jgi:DNA-binding response OmpR family regulator
MYVDQRTTTASQALVALLPSAERPAAQRRFVDQGVTIVSPWSYLAKRGRGTIRLTLIEFRILELLASHPNQVFTPADIAAAVTTDHHPVTAETLCGYVASLRSQLGFFSDYIQTVPYLGYRFKA